MSAGGQLQEHFYHTLFESVGEGLVLVNKEGIIVETNPRVEELFGFEKEELLGSTIEILIPESVRKNHHQHRIDYTKSPRKRNMGSGMNLQARKKDGTHFPVEISLNHFNNDGEMFVMALITDITERNKMEEALKGTEIALRSMHQITSNQALGFDEKIAELLEFGSLQFGLETGILARIEGDDYHVEEVVGRIEGIRKGDVRVLDHTYCYDIIHREEPLHIEHASESRWNAHPCYVNTKLESYIGARINVNHQVYGTISFVSSIAKPTPFSSTEKELLKLMAEWVGEAIQQKKAKEELHSLNAQLEKRVEERTEALRESQRLYSIIARNFPNGTINVFDRQLNYVFVEGRELYKLGVTNENLIGTPYLDRIPETLVDEVRTALEQVFEGENKTFELSSNDQYYEMTAVPLTNTIGEIKQIMMVEQNVTHQKKAADEMRKALQKEKELGELKTRFVSMASHEFRTPLSTVLSSASLIGRYQKQEDEPKRLKHVNRIKSAVNTLTGILNDFLSLDKLEEGKVEYIPQLFNLQQLVEQVVDEMQTVARKNQQIVLQYSGESQGNCDSQIMRNILHNLLSNAIKYSPEDKNIDLTIVVNDTIHMEVKDRGIGIPDKDKEHMFDRFFRAGNSTNIQGTGLGLNIVKKYLDLMGGTIHFESEEYIGTTFFITIPNQTA